MNFKYEDIIVEKDDTNVRTIKEEYPVLLSHDWARQIGIATIKIVDNIMYADLALMEDYSNMIPSIGFKYLGGADDINSLEIELFAISLSVMGNVDLTIKSISEQKEKKL